MAKIVVINVINEYQNQATKNRKLNVSNQRKFKIGDTKKKN